MESPYTFDIKNYFWSYIRQFYHYVTEKEHGRGLSYDKSTENYDLNYQPLMDYKSNIAVQRVHRLAETPTPLKKNLTEPETEYCEKVDAVVMTYENYAALIHEVDRHRQEIAEIRDQLKNLSDNKS